MTRNWNIHSNTGKRTASASDKRRFEQLLLPTCTAEGAQAMKNFRQHGDSSTFQHCIDVAWSSYHLSQILHMPIDEKALIRGAFLHDYYGYDWHTTCNKAHAINHPRIAETRATCDFALNSKERNIIRSHMWPLPPTRIPKSREAWIVCLCDKTCALRETLSALKSVPFRDEI